MKPLREKFLSLINTKLKGVKDEIHDGVYWCVEYPVEEITFLYIASEITRHLNKKIKET